MRTYSIWLTSIIVLTVGAFLVVFRPLTFVPRKDPSDASRYLRPVGVSSFDPTKPPAQPTVNLGRTGLYVYVPQHDLRLGLDLRGGMRVVLQIPDRAIFTYNLKEGVVADPTAAAQKQEELTKGLAADAALGPDAGDPQKVKITVNEKQVQIVTQPQNNEVAQSQLGLITPVMKTVFGDGKFEEPDPEKVFTPVDPETQKSILTIMEKRLNSSGTSEVVSYAKGTDQVVLEIPGVKNPDEVQKLLKTTAEMEFRLLPQDITVETDPKTREVTAITRGGKEITHDEAIQASYLVISGSDLEPKCDVTYDNEHKPAISFTLKPNAADHFADITAGNINRALAIVLDKKIISAPVIQARIYKNGIITGARTLEEAKQEANLLNAGAMPVPVKIVENRTVSATLGADSVSLSMKAGLIGLALVLIFMFAYYRLPGLMANLALVIYIVVTLAVLKIFDATLTLPGIAGIIISIGMAVDANVIIFERLKEELRTKKPLGTAIDVAFARAWTAILDSNVASIITGSVLYWLGTGAVRGFAVTLLIGVIVSLFTAITITRLFMRLMIRTKAGHNLAWYGV